MQCISSKGMASSDPFARLADGVKLMDFRCAVDVMG